MANQPQDVRGKLLHTTQASAIRYLIKRQVGRLGFFGSVFSGAFNATITSRKADCQRWRERLPFFSCSVPVYRVFLLRYCCYLWGVTTLPDCTEVAQNVKLT
jgi:hypothetical protein